MKQMTQSAFETSLAYETYTMQSKDFIEATTASMEKRQGKYTGS